MRSAKNLHHSVRLLIIGSLLIPSVLFVAAAWLDYQTTRGRADEYFSVAANALAEQASEALQTASGILARTLDRIDRMEWLEINGSREVHDFLARIGQEMALVQSVFLIDPDGYNSASSRAFPMQAFDNRDREYFIQAKKGDDHLYVSAAFLGRMTGLAGFTVSRPRLTNGRFDGVVAVTLSPAYFKSFYEKIALSTQHATAALVRTDGKLLVRYPEVPGVSQLPETSPLLQIAESGAQTGIFSGTSSVDGVLRLSAFRRVADQPLLANFALAKGYYLGPWYTHLMWMAAFAFLTMVALLWTSSLVVRRAATEEAHLRRLLEESERRKEAEQVVQHLQKMEALGRLSGGVAHDFNNLLAAIMGALELASGRINDPVRLPRLLATAMQAAQRGARLTAQMLAFSRDKDIAPEPLDINGIIRESEGLIQRTADALVEVSYSLDEHLWPAIGDRVQFEVALLNLAGNARDAMPLGGKLLFMTRNVRLTAGDQPGIEAGEYVQISVTDTGEGMTPETKERAFDPFFSTKGVGKGTGLGLSQVYGFANHLGGMVNIKSGIGEGTTVTIWLPRTQEPAAPHEEPGLYSQGSPKSLKILLVDDDKAVLSLTEEMLGELGHTVSIAENGPNALTLLTGPAQFDLLLADFAMPVMNGAQLAAEAIKRQPHLAILFMSGYADTTLLNAWTESGYRALKKPFSAAELDSAIRQTIRARPPKGNVLSFPAGQGLSRSENA